jgi:hypothetical protein
MNKLSLFIFILLVCGYQGKVSASCDACAKAALESAEASIKAGVDTTISVVQANGTSIESAGLSVDSGSSLLSTLIQTLGSQEITALDGVAKKVTFSIERLGIESTRGTDVLVSNLIKGEKELRVADNALENERTFGVMSQPLSGEINTARSFDLSTGFANRNALKSKHIENMEGWLNNNGFFMSKSRERSVLIATPEFWNPTPLLTKNRLSNEEVGHMQMMLRLLVNAEPMAKVAQPLVASSPLKAKQELQRLKDVILQQVSHSILSESLVNKAPTITLSDDWKKAYFNIESDVDNKISFEQFYEAETTGKLVSSDWFLDIKTKTKAGLLREQIYQMNTANLLLAEIVKAERAESKLLALSILKGG